MLFWSTLECPGRLPKTKFYVFSVGNIALLLYKSSVDVHVFEKIIMTDMMTVIVILLQYF